MAAGGASDARYSLTATRSRSPFRAAASRGLPTYYDGFVGLLRAATSLRGRRVAMPHDELATISQPTLLMWGSHDTHGPVETGRRMTAVMPNARLEVCGVGHLPWLDEPERCGQLVGEFLRGS